MSQKIYTDLIVKGSITLSTTNAGIDTDKFLVQDASGTIKFRTGAELLSDIGAGAGGATNLSYTASPTNGIVVSDTGTDATIPLADATNAGLLKPADFTQLSNLTSNLAAKVSGTGTAGYVAFWNGTSSQIGSSNLFWDNTNKYLGVGTSSPQTQIHLRNATSVGIIRIQGLGDTDNYSVLELWDDAGASKWQFAHKVFAGETKDFSFAHWNGTSWIQPMRLKDSGRILLGVGTTDDGVTTNLVQIGGYIRAAGYRITGGLTDQFLKADGSTDSTPYLFSVGISDLTATGTPDSTTYLRGDNTWATISGGGTPAGITGEIQYNDAGTFGASSDFVWNNTLKTLTLGGTDTDIIMKCVTNEPSTPTTGNLAIYTKKMGGKTVLKTKDEFGVDFSMQSSFWDNNVVMWNCTNATAGAWIGTVGTSAGSFANTLPTSASLSASIKRALYSNVVTTTNQVLGVYGSENLFMRGPVSAFGGFYFYSRFTFDVWTNGGRLFTGLSAVATATNIIATNPSTATNIHTCGFAVNDTDAGIIYFITNNGTTTTAQIVTGMPAILSGRSYDAYIYCAPGGTTIYWRLEELSTNTTITGSQTVTLPNNNTTMKPYCVASNAALTPVNSIRLGVNKIYIETDY